MSRIARSPLWILTAFALALAAAGAGCGYEHRNGSDVPAPEKIPKAREKVPLRAVCDWHADSSNETGAVALAKSLSTAVDTLGANVTEAELFEGVSSRGDAPRDLRENELLLLVSERTTALPEDKDVWRVLGILPGLYGLLAVYSERTTPLTMEFEMRCIDPRGDLVARYAAQAKIFVNMQNSFEWFDKGRIEGEDMARAYAAKILAAKLSSDEVLPVEVRRKIEARPAVAATAAGADSAQTFTATGTTPPAPIPAPLEGGSVFVLVVGINGYSDARIPALRFAEPDAREVYAYFATERRSPTDADRVQLLTGKAATRRGVREAIREHLVKKAIRPVDTAILYFAGHGFRDADDTYLACQDASIDGLPDTAISMEELRSLWSKIGGERKVLLVDACHSGAVGSVRGIGGVALAPDGASTHARAGETLAISATGPNELSTEDENLGHGVFTIGLLKGLRGEADADKDGRVTGAELGAFVQSEVPRLATRAGGRQTPVVSGLEGRPIVLAR